MNSKEFENLCLQRMTQESKRGVATMSRYGVQGSFVKGRPVDRGILYRFSELIVKHGVEHGIGYLQNLLELENVSQSIDHWQPMDSYPDFDGVTAPAGRQFTCDAKVCNQASFPLDAESKSLSRQLRHMMERDRFGVIAFYLIHFPERALATKTDPEATWAFPVSGEHPFWIQFERAEVKRITRQDCEAYAVPVAWNTLPGHHKPLPDIVTAVHQLESLR